jgi:DNA-binding beta-propeller fold protein YncE
VDEHEILIPRPHALAVSFDGAWVHTASLSENRIAYIEVKTGRVRLTTIPGAERSLVQFALSPDGRTMVAGGELSNTLLVFDLTQPPPFTPVREISVEGKPWEPRFSPDGRTLYLTLLSKNAVAELDVASWSVRRTMDQRFAQPYGMILRGDGRYAFVTNQNSAPVHEGHSGHAMHGMDGQNPNDGWLTVLDLVSGAVHSTLMLGNGPTGAGAARAR